MVFMSGRNAWLIDSFETDSVMYMLEIKNAMPPFCYRLVEVAFLRLYYYYQEMTNS